MHQDELLLLLGRISRTELHSVFVSLPLTML